MFSPYALQALLEWLASSYSYTVATNTVQLAPNQNIQEGILRTGYIGVIGGFNIWVADASYTSVASNAATDIAFYGAPGAIAFADQVDNVEALRLENRFATGVRGQYNYGLKLLNANLIRKQEIAMTNIKA